MSLITLDGIGKSYGEGETKFDALKGISFNIKPGEFVSIVGPSGSGKSTLLHILGLLDRQSSGTYEFEGKAVREYSDDELARFRNKKIGFVFQTFNLLPRTSTLDNVMLPLVYSEIPETEWKNRAHAAIDIVGLMHRLDHTSLELSGGERQRVAIARALVNEPSVIFADEPTGNLDSKSGRAVMDTLQALNERGHTIIVVTHEKYTSNYADRILSLFDGELVSDVPVPESEKTTNANFMK